MTSKERVRAALEHRPPDRPPVFEYFWPQWEDRWLVEKGFASWEEIEARGRGAHDWDRPRPEDWCYPWERDIYDYYEIDLRLIGANFDPSLSGDATLEEKAEYRILRDGWRVIRKEPRSAEETNAPACVVESPIRSLADLSSYGFDSPADPRRFAAWAREVARHPDVPFFINLPGPFAAYCKLCGMERALLDISDRPDFVRRVVEWIADFEIEVGVQQAAVAAALGNSVLGAWLFEDIACNRGLLMSPHSYRQACQPALARLGGGLRRAGAEFLILHSDGDIRQAVPLLIESGVDAIQPLEARAGMDVNELQALYGHSLCFIGNIDNTRTLALGTCDDIRREVLRKLQAGRNGGYIVGSSHSVGLDVPTRNYDYFRELVRAFPPALG